MRSQFLIAVSSSIAALAIASPAIAQTEEKPFDGVYIGASVGYDMQSSDRGSTILFDRDLNGSFGDTVTTSGGANAFSPGFCSGRARTSAPLDGCVNDKDGISYSARVGFDKQFGSIVAGLVGEFGKSEVRDSVSAYSTTPARYSMTREVDWNANLRARLGYAANTTLFYATGGGAYARVDSTFQTSNTANSFTGRGKRGAWGFVAGGGIEQKLSPSFSVGLEYLFNQYKDDDYVVRAGPGTAPMTNPFLLGNANGTDFIRSDDKFRWHSVRATAAFRF
ncbi:outer membrane beta-barrel protein [Sphingomonas sp. QA11]|uniref:outer membrane protein n=1 Tax=Sphingomonas sp. QA11 TaxID=2950605 RepID=UPI00234A4125|nr:outer membrane beta-barrel protein [Sphingomonas sp. QA11]WCM28165.1 outer membrane beta-barrel protein [Sphingomonas sp. QA11]